MDKAELFRGLSPQCPGLRPSLVTHAFSLTGSLSRGDRRSSAPTEGLEGRCVSHPNPREPMRPGSQGPRTDRGAGVSRGQGYRSLTQGDHIWVLRQFLAQRPRSSGNEEAKLPSLHLPHPGVSTQPLLPQTQECSPVHSGTRAPLPRSWGQGSSGAELWGVEECVWEDQ